MLSESLRGEWLLQQVGGDLKVPAQVPGGVHTDLLAASAIPDPFFGDNELRVQWVAEQDWQFSREFQVSSDMLAHDRVFLACDGLDTLGSVEVNGQRVGKFENAFRDYRWEIKRLLKEGANQIVFTFDSAVKYGQAREAELPLGSSQTWSILGGPHVRKAPCQFGWDWGPMLPPIGIWKDLRIEGYTVARLDDVHLRQKLIDGKATLTAALSTERWTDTPMQAEILVTSPDGKQYRQTAEGSGENAALSVEVENPALWWPNGYGEQALYDVAVVLHANGQEIDRRSYKIGFRTIELQQEPDQWGESFTFVVNGVPVFAKGADWIPADSFPTRISDTHLDWLLRSAADANMNMVRVWGGGFYEEERFYNLCDAYGLLVWQDFTFACNRYPGSEEFFENVRTEAMDNIRRLRHRASLAIWCGNNEMEQAWAEWGWDRRAEPAAQRLKIAYDRMFHHMLPEVVAAEDPDRTYWPSSASSGIPFSEPNGQQRGDCHYWDVWHGRKPFTAYRTQFPRFMSEFGFQSLPPLETVRAYADPSDWNMTSYVMEHHQRSYKGNGLILSQMTDTFRMPKDFPMLVYLSMVLQGEGIRYGVEHWRRHKERVSGILIWQLNDCWPVASWSSIDYFGRWKALHYMARRFYAPLLLSIEDHEESGQMDVWLSSDIPQPVDASVQWKLVTLGGEVLDEGQVDVALEAQASRRIFSRVFELNREQRRDTVFVCNLVREGERVSQCIATFTASKHLEIVDPQLKVEAQITGGQAVINLRAGTLARFVELSLQGTDVVFSDNYFDLPAGDSVKVTCPLPEGWDEDRLRQSLRFVSLYDSF